MARGLALVVALLTVAPAVAADPPRFRWQQGQVLAFAVRQTTTLTETTLEQGTNKPRTGTTSTLLALAKRWEVKAVDAAGTATLELSITAMRQEIARPGPADKDGKPTTDQLVIDSATPEGRKQTEGYLGKPILTVTVDALGRVTDAKAAQGSADRVQAELPFRVVLPDQWPQVGGKWDRSFPIQINPPLGTGEKYDAVQTFTFKGEGQGGHAVVGIATELKAPPKDAAELPPLVPLLWEGEAYFHPVTGRYAGARLSVKKEVANHQGEGTKFAYESKYEEGATEK